MKPTTDPSSRSTSSLPPLKNPRFQHISRSAAKRESVQFLGSIKDLQAHFSRSGLVEHRPGFGVGVRNLGSLGEDEENQPPGEDEGREEEKRQRERQPWKEIELHRVDLKAARKEARGLLHILRGIWDLGVLPSLSSRSISASPTSPTGKIKPDTRTILTTTAHSIRRVRSLTLAISHTAQPGLRDRRLSTPTLHPPRPSKARSSFSTPSRPSTLPRAVSMGAAERKSSFTPMKVKALENDMVGDLRKAALDVLAGIRGVEESLRIQTPPPTELDGPSQREGVTSPSGETSQTSSSALEMEYTGKTSIRPSSAASNYYSQSDNYLDDDEDYSNNYLNHSDEVKHATPWEDRIVSEDRQYRSIDENMDGKIEVRGRLKSWITIVERIFQVVAVEEEGGIEEWATNVWEGKPLGTFTSMPNIPGLSKHDDQNACTHFSPHISLRTVKYSSLRQHPVI